ncbi:RAD9, HUS1, RAD1-interacting nuclear orphan protein 1 [Ara ararauna]
MPPKKKCTKARKAELVFLERPREGPIHCYEAPLRSAEKPRRVPTKPVDRNTSAAWVCPQFDTTTSVALKTCQKQHRGPHKPQNHDANYSSLHTGGACRRAIACKFPPLTFEKTEGGAVHTSDDLNHLRKHTQHLHRQPKEGTAVKAKIQVNNNLVNCREIPLLPAPQSVEPEVCSSPDVETAQVPPISNWRCSSALSQSSSHAWHPEKELVFGTDSCEGRELESAAVLVTDTPEHQYGVKVTWRQRPLIMKYLQNRGKLSAADILVKTNLELSRGQTNV